MGVRQLAGQTLIYGLSSIIGRAVNSVVLSFLYVRYFSPDEFGLFSYFYALISYPIIVLVLGMETSYFRHAHIGTTTDDRAYSNGYWCVFYVSALLCGLCFLFSESLAAYVGYPQRGLLMRYLIGITFLDVVVAMPMARLRHRERPYHFAAIHMANLGVVIVLNILFVVVFRWRVEAIFLANLISSAVKFVIATLYGIPKNWTLDWKTTAPMLSFGLLIMVAGFAGQINEMLDKNLIVLLWQDGTRFLGKPRTGEEMNGIYNASYKFGMLMAVATQAFRYAAEPFFFRQAGGERSPVLFARVFHFFALAGLVATLLVATFRNDLAFFDFFGQLQVPLLPEAYWPGLGIIPIILFSNLFLGLYINVAIWFKLQGKATWGLWFTLMGTVLTVGINYFGIPTFGFFASAWAHVITYGSMFFVCYLIGQRFYPIPYRMDRFLLYAVVVLFGILLLEYTADGYHFNRWLQGGVIAVVLGFIYLVEKRWPSFRTK